MLIYASGVWAQASKVSVLRTLGGIGCYFSILVVILRISSARRYQAGHFDVPRLVEMKCIHIIPLHYVLLYVSVYCALLLLPEFLICLSKILVLARSCVVQAESC